MNPESLAEPVIYRTRLHAIVFLWPVLLSLVGLFFITLMPTFNLYDPNASWPVVKPDDAATREYLLAKGLIQNPSPIAVIPLNLVGFGFLILGALLSLSMAFNYNNARFEVTPDRIRARTGFLTQRSREILLSKVESFDLTQSWLGESIGYGNVAITGTGGTKEGFNALRSPEEFHQAIQTAITRS